MHLHNGHQEKKKKLNKAIFRFITDSSSIVVISAPFDFSRICSIWSTARKRSLESFISRILTNMTKYDRSNTPRKIKRLTLAKAHRRKSNPIEKNSHLLWIARRPRLVLHKVRPMTKKSTRMDHGGGCSTSILAYRLESTMASLLVSCAHWLESEVHILPILYLAI